MKHLVTHPDNLATIRQIVNEACGQEVQLGSVFNITTNQYLPRFVTKWEPPRERFFEYDKSDEPWLRYFGFGTIRQTTEPLIYEFKDPASFLGTAFQMVSPC